MTKRRFVSAPTGQYFEWLLSSGDQELTEGVATGELRSLGIFAGELVTDAVE